MNKTMIIKDNEITKLLRSFANFNEAHIVLKGGTCLTKGHQIGNRMSEDVDILVFTDNKLSNNKKLEIMKNIRKIIIDQFNLLEEKPKGGGRTHYSAEFYGKRNIDDAIKIDVRFSEKPIDFVKKEIYEFNEEGELVSAKFKFLVSELIDIFYEKIFSFQNRAYTYLVKKSSKPKIKESERQMNTIPLFKTKRLARHVFDITNIFNKGFITKEKINEMISKEKESHILKNKEWLKKSYTKKLHLFLIFNRDEIIKKWLKTISEDFLVPLNIDETLKKIKNIRMIIKNSYE